MSQILFISLSGLIGAGKTTLATALAESLGVPVHYEKVVDNVYLEDFYRDMPTYAFPLQIYLLNHRFRQHQQITWQGQGAVQDRSIYEDKIFCQMLREAGHISKRDFDTYNELFNNMTNFMRRPSLIVHLDVTPAESLERIRLRGRASEQGITLEYLTALYAGYRRLSFFCESL
jgi:deoxyadenosine/deoxycytidine kinase